MTDTISRIMKIRDGMTPDADAKAIIEREIAALQPRSSPATATLLPCPFCGGTMEEVTDEDGHYWVHPGRKGMERADCWLCDAWVSDEPTGEGSIGEWNQRAQCSAGSEEVKLAYVKRWRTIVKLPAKYADEIVEALRTPDVAKAATPTSAAQDENDPFRGVAQPSRIDLDEDGMAQHREKVRR